MIRISNQYVWNSIFLIFFLTVFVMGLIIVESEGYLTRDSLTMFDITLLVLATFRFVWFFLYDGITRFFREQFYDVEVKRGGKPQLAKPSAGPRRTIADLLSCPWAFGLGAASVITFFYLLTPLAYVPVLILAIAGVASLLHLIVFAISSHITAQ